MSMIVNVTHAGVYHYRCLTCEVGAGHMTDEQVRAERLQGHHLVRDILVQDVWRRERPAVLHAWAYGPEGGAVAPGEVGTKDGFECPFCWQVTVVPGGVNPSRCLTPWCEAAPDSSEAVRGLFVDQAHERALDTERELQRVRTMEARIRGLDQERARERKEHQARVEEAKRRGACAACATKDLRRPAKWVRHRAETFCPTSGRRG